MPFTPKSWKNANSFAGGGDTSTPLSAAALEDLETRLSDYTDDRLDPTQGAEGTVVEFAAVAPATAGAADFQVQMNSFANAGAGAGTRNHGVWMGWNVGHYTGGPTQADYQGLYMGFEDNYYDNGGDESYGVEWYVGYTTPDGTTIGPADLRPIYFRVEDSDVDNATKNVNFWVDIGSGSGGAFAVLNGQVAGTELFVCLPTSVTSFQQFQVTPASGPAAIVLNAPDTGVSGSLNSIWFKRSGTSKFRITSDQFNQIFIFDEVNSRFQVVFLAGNSVTNATADFYCSVKIQGNVGFYNTAPVAKPTVSGSRGGNAALASLLTALANQGLITNSSSA